MTITPDDFNQVEMRVGRIVAVEDLEEARRPSYRLTIDFGPLGLRRSAAGLRTSYTKEELAGRLIVAVVNLPSRQVATTMSEVLVLGALLAGGGVALLSPDGGAEPGSRIG